MKRIVFFVSSMQGGGAECVAALLCNAWAARGHAVTLVPTYSGRGGCSYPLAPNVQLTYLADRVGTTRRSPWTLIRRLAAMRAMIRAQAPDAVVAFLPPVNVAAILAASGLGVPVVVSERIYPPALPLGPVWHLLRRVTYPRAAAVVVQTRRGLAWLQRAVPGARGQVIANPCVYPLPAGEPVKTPASYVDCGRQVVLAAGRLTPQKDFATLLAAFAELASRYPAWDLVILGEGEQRRALEDQRAALGLTERIHFPGYAGNMGDWYRRSEIFALSSQFEGFPNTLMEAMAHGLPVVSTDCVTGPGDLITHWVDGLLVDPRTGAGGLAAGLDELMADAATRQRFGAAAAGVADRFAPERVASAWLALMAEALPPG